VADTTRPVLPVPAPQGDSLVTLNKEEIKAAMRGNLDVLAQVVMPDVFNQPFGKYHKAMWNLAIRSVMKNRMDEALAIFEKFALGLPRGHAKTTMLKLLVLFIILFTKRGFILVLCSNFTKAESFVEDVVLLLNSPNVIQLFGSWDAYSTKDNAKIKKFNFCGRDIILKPQGIGGSVRGIAENLRRPDVIICDDIQEKEDAENPEQAEKLIDWFLSTLGLARDMQVCTIFYLGNMYKDIELYKRDSGIYACLLRNLQKDPEWTSMIVGAILADGTALWEAVISLETLLKELRTATAMGKEDVFFAELMNDPTVRMSAWYDPGKVPPLPYNEYDVVIGKFLVIDPSLGQKKSDEQVVGLFYVYDEKGPVLHKIRKIQKASPQLVQDVLVWALEERVPLVVTEHAAFQGTLTQWFVYWCDTLGIESIQFIGITPKGLSKTSRILSYFKSLMYGSSMASYEAHSLIDAQAALYRPTSAKNVDDILDLGAYGEQVFLQYSGLFLLPLDATYTTVHKHNPNKALHRKILEGIGNSLTF
jgi:hypothetical protein